MTGVEGVSQVLICDPCTGGEFSVGQKLLAWAKAGGNNARRQQYRQKNVGTPWESGGEHARACRVCVIYALLLPSARMKPLSPTTARGEGKVHTRGTHLRRDTFIPQRFQASKAAAASDGHAVHF